MEDFAEGYCLVITLDFFSSVLHGIGFKLEDIIPGLESGLLVHTSPPSRSLFGLHVGIICSQYLGCHLAFAVDKPCWHITV
jgi:hypothetical protein